MQENKDDFKHYTVMLHEAVEGMNPKDSNKIFVDATLGGGGHTKLIAQYLGPKGRVISFDVDEDAIKKASEAAKKNTFNIKLVKGATISHEVVGKFGACNVYLKPAPEGTGIIAGGPVRAILELAGVQNVCSKVYGSRAPINIIRATNQGLNNLKSYKETRTLRSKE